MIALSIMLALFYLIALYYKRIYMGDSAEYILEAVNIKDHFYFYSGSPSLPATQEFLTLRPPLYPMFLALVYSFYLNNWLVIALQGLICMANITIMRSTLSYLGYHKKYDPLLLLFILAYPIQFIYSYNIASDILLQFFAILYLRFGILLFVNNNLKYAIYMSLALIAGAFVKPIFYPLALPHILLLIAFTLKLKLPRANLIIAVMLPIVAFMAYNYWNYARTGKFHFSSIEAINSRYNTFEYINAKQGAQQGQIYRNQLIQSINRIPSYKQRYDTSMQVSGNFIKSHFSSYAIFHLIHAARIFIEPGKAEIDLFSHHLTDIDVRAVQTANNGFYATIKQQGWQGFSAYFNRNPTMPIILIIIVFNFLRLLGFILFMLNTNIKLIIRFFIAAFAILVALAAGPVANTHYFMPISLWFIGVSVLGWSSLLRKNKQTTLI